MDIKILKGQMTRFCFSTKNGKAAVLDVFTFIRGKQNPLKFYELTIFVEGVDIAAPRYSSYEVGSDNYYSSLRPHIDGNNGVIYITDRCGKDIALIMPADVSSAVTELIN